MCNNRKTHIVGLILNVCMRHMRKSMQFQPGLYKDKWNLAERLQKKLGNSLYNFSVLHE